MMGLMNTLMREYLRGDNTLIQTEPCASSSLTREPDLNFLLEVERASRSSSPMSLTANST